ncbi:MAG: hypothetical protein KDB53_05360 [Planctomycetes bacterium]|nr:hypothetical protein [Planctomycetota bacterium]
MPAELVTKRMRQDMILEIVKSCEVHNQLELIKRLEERGITATQSSVSRDIHELSIAKVDGRYVVAVLPMHGGDEETDYEQYEGRGFIRTLSPAGPSVLVVKTNPEQGGAVGTAINRARWPEVLGTIAGADTIFIATAGKREQMRLITRLQQFMDDPNAIIIPSDDEAVEQLMDVTPTSRFANRELQPTH